MQYCKSQIGCMLIVFDITFIYIREKSGIPDKKQANTDSAKIAEMKTCNKDLKLCDK